MRTFFKVLLIIGIILFTLLITLLSYWLENWWILGWYFILIIVFAGLIFGIGKIVKKIKSDPEPTLVSQKKEIINQEKGSIKLKRKMVKNFDDLLIDPNETITEIGPDGNKQAILTIHAKGKYEPLSDYYGIMNLSHHALNFDVIADRDNKITEEKLYELKETLATALPKTETKKIVPIRNEETGIVGHEVTITRQSPEEYEDNLEEERVNDERRVG